MTGYILAIDQGTTSSRALVLDAAYNVIGSAQQEFRQIYPASGWVEHDAGDIWGSVVETCRAAITKAGIAKPGLSAADLAAIGITNQRETTLVWDRATGKPVYNAIVWQDRRTADETNSLRERGFEAAVTDKTGLLLDPYFSASKIAWILDNVAGARKKAEAGKLAFGTVDTYLIWRMTGGKRHVTDATNASRTMIYDIHKGEWCSELLDLFRVPRAILPDVLDCAADFGVCDAEILGAAVPISGVAGDQQAATIGQACFSPGMVKSTYGTGCFAMLNTGKQAVKSENRLLTTIAYRLGGEVTYALEGSIFVAGAAVQWLRDGLGIIERADQSGPLADTAEDDEVYLVPAFVGLGAPHWDPDCRGALYGLTRATGPAELARAALESVCFQTLDLIDAMHADWTPEQEFGGETVLRVDGGMVASEWMLQRLADILAAPIDRPKMLETTALGAAYLAGMQAGIYGDPASFAREWACDRRYAARMDSDTRARKIQGWQTAVRRTLL
ncbi:glycerol kinase GlpK [Thalassospiraceae bacterium LMO-JJ14]|nr:glycerol kinase GlpK [Thalassospiraceae bacterium LMO-JJ14]